MHLDHDKFFDLLVSNSGMTVEKTEKQLSQLITEMKAAFDEDDAYEIEGFGIFSKLGSNVLFIPSEELETEINYKYAGMEPIELPGSAENNLSEEFPENPIQGIIGGSGKPEYEDPFAALLNGDDDEEEDSIEEYPSLDEDIVEEETEVPETTADDSDDDILDEFFGDDPLDDEPETETLAEAIDALSEEEGDDEESSSDLDEDPFGNLSEEESVADDELQDNEEDETIVKPGPEKWGIDAHKEDGQENAFSGLMGDSKEEADDEIVFESMNDNSDSNEDDPFSELEDSSTSKDDFIPVVTNVSSEIPKKDAIDEVLNSKDPSAKTPKRKNVTAILVNVFLLLIILVSGTYMLAYFDVIRIDGITKGTKPVTERITPVQNKEKLSEAFDKLSSEMQEKMQQGSGVSGPKEQPAQISANVTTTEKLAENVIQSVTPTSTTPKEQELQKDVTPTPTSNTASLTTTVSVNNSNSRATDDVAEYGLSGSVNEAANSGYTIVLYTLSKKEGVDRATKNLEAQGLRVLIKESPSTKYGLLYRVSIGQFRTLVDAATAVEENKKMFSENYSITKIK
tara:strand:- start:15207 stop:16913 length:1707 start_codon:yes stop_codon:yes gene_type:complete